MSKLGYESLVYYYGIYSSSYRGKEKKENTDEVVEVEEVRATGKASSTWARLIRKIFEVDVLCCKKCGGEIHPVRDHGNDKEIYSANRKIS